MRISGKCIGADHAIVNDWFGNLILDASAAVEGRTITVDGTKANAKGRTCVLQVNSEDNLSKLATVNLVSIGKLDIAAGVACLVSELKINGVAQPEGTYTAADLPNSISGEGSITVAKVKYWTGGAEGSISDSDNWSDKLAPADGDVLSFLPGEKVTLTGSYEIADGQTLTIDNQCAIDDGVAFTGAGKLVIRGSGDFNVKARAWHSGGTRVDNGLFYFGDNSVTSLWSQYQTCFGSSDAEIELVRYSDSSPTLYLNVGKQLINPVRITGAITRGNGALKCGNPNSVFLSTVTADSDFLINCGWGGVTFNKDVSAPGHKVYCVSSTGGGGVDAIQFNGNVDADIVKERGWDLGVTGEPDNNWSGSWAVKLTGVSTNENRLLDVKWRTVIVLTETAQWAGNVRVDGARAAKWNMSDTALQITSRANLRKTAVVNLLNGGKLDIAAGVTAKVAELYVDGQRQPDGVYTAASRPAAIAGEGRLTVGRMGLFFIVK